MARTGKGKHDVRAGALAKDRHRKDGKVISGFAPRRPQTQQPTRVVHHLQQNPNDPDRYQVFEGRKKFQYASTFELVKNENRKDKKINLEMTTATEPPPGYRFVPNGNPDLSKACKELSREQDAMVFIVSLANRKKSPKSGSPSSSDDDEDNEFSEKFKDYRTQMTRLGYHFREAIVEQARQHLNLTENDIVPGPSSVRQNAQGHIVPEPIPDSQVEISRQADAAIRDLFPRIPYADKQMIIDHAFLKGSKYKGMVKVGLAPDIPLSRRVQLAVLAHIRHVHTRYDKLLRELGYKEARRLVEGPCLDILVKWRADEETGRDTAPEVLRELVVIDDSDDEDDDETEDSDDNDNSDLDDIRAPPQAVPVAMEVAGRPSAFGPWVPESTPVDRLSTNYVHHPRVLRPMHHGPARVTKRVGAQQRRGDFDRYRQEFQKLQAAQHQASSVASPPRDVVIGGHSCSSSRQVIVLETPSQPRIVHGRQASAYSHVERPFDNFGVHHSRYQEHEFNQYPSPRFTVAYDMVRPGECRPSNTAASCTQLDQALHRSPTRRIQDVPVKSIEPASLDTGFPPQPCSVPSRADHLNGRFRPPLTHAQDQWPASHDGLAIRRDEPEFRRVVRELPPFIDLTSHHFTPSSLPKPTFIPSIGHSHLSGPMHSHPQPPKNNESPWVRDCPSKVGGGRPTDQNAFSRDAPHALFAEEPLPRERTIGPQKWEAIVQRDSSIYETRHSPEKSFVHIRHTGGSLRHVPYSRSPPAQHSTGSRPVAMHTLVPTNREAPLSGGPVFVGPVNRSQFSVRKYSDRPVASAAVQRHDTIFGPVPDSYRHAPNYNDEPPVRQNHAFGLEYNRQSVIDAYAKRQPLPSPHHITRREEVVIIE